MVSFKLFCEDNSLRQMTTLGRTQSRTQKMNTGVGRLHQNMVPAYKKADPNKIQPVEQLRSRNNGMRALGPAEVSKIQQQYGITDLKPGKSRQLGNSGMTLQYNPATGGYILKK